jgi:translation initiation factor 6 (eIF-6)
MTDTNKVEDELEAEVYGVEVAHHYYVGANSTKNRHACLLEGWWCWQNFRQHPLDIRFYIKKKRKGNR